MICPKCNSEIRDGSKFCYVCGASLAEAQQNEEVQTQTVYQPQEPEQPAYQPQEPAQPAYQQPPQQEYQPQNNSDKYAQQFQQFQQSNQQFKNPQYSSQPASYGQPMNNVAIQPAKKKSPVPIIIIAAVALLAVAGIIIGIIMVFSGGDSSKVVDHFTTVINSKSVDAIKPDLFDENRLALETSSSAFSYISSAFSKIPDGVKVKHKIVSTEVYNQGEPKFADYAKNLFSKYKSIGSAAAVTERNIIYVSYSIDGMSALDGLMTLYFDVAKVNGQWKIVEVNNSKSSFSYLN